MPSRGFARGLGFKKRKLAWALLGGVSFPATLDLDFTTNNAVINLIQNGDFATFGPELILNGTFTDTSAWVLKTPAVGTETMTISGGTLNLTGDGTNQAYADQSFTTVVGQVYQISAATLAGTSSFTVGTTQGGSQNGSQSMGAANTTFTLTFTATAATTWVRFTKLSATLVQIDNVSVKASGWLLKVPVGTESATISGGVLNLTGDGTNAAYADQSFATVSGQSYTLTFTNSNTISATVGIAQGSSSVLTSTPTAGSQSFTFTATAATTWVRFQRLSASLGTIDNVSVKPAAFAGVPLSVVNSSGGYAQTSAGAWTNFAANTARITDKGLLVEEQRTTLIANSVAAGSVAGSPGTVPTNWFLTNSTTGLTRTIIGTGVEDGIDYIDVRFQGDGSVSFRVAAGGTLTMAASSAYTGSFFVKLIGGSLTNSPLSVRIVTEAATVSTAGAVGIIPTASGLGSQRFAVTKTTLADTTTGRCDVLNTVSAGNAFDLTLRIGWPQLELGAFATSPIRTTGTTATRAADVVKLTSIPWFNASAGTLYAEGGPNQAPPAASTSAPILASFTNGTANERVYLRRDDTAKDASAGVNAGGVGQSAHTAVGDLWDNGNSKKLIIAYAANDSQPAFEGVLQTQDVTVTLPTITELGFGVLVSGNPLNGYLRRVAYWNTRLANATLQSLTT